MASRDFGMGIFPSVLCCLLVRTACSPLPAPATWTVAMDPIPALDVFLLPKSPLRELPVCLSAQMGERVSLKALVII